MNDPDGSAWLAIITELQRDAARWRWLRACHGWPAVDVAGYSPAEFDALADRLRKTKEIA